MNFHNFTYALDVCRNKKPKYFPKTIKRVLLIEKYKKPKNGKIFIGFKRF